MSYFLHHMFSASSCCNRDKVRDIKFDLLGRFTGRGVYLGFPWLQLSPILPQFFKISGSVLTLALTPR